MTGYGATIARDLGRALNDGAAKFMLAAPTAAKGEQLGFADPTQFYIAGRHGVLGDISPEALAAVHGFLSGLTAKMMWPAAAGVCSRETAAEAFGAACAEYGEDKLAEWPEQRAARLVELAEPLVDAAPATPLFAAWRAAPRPQAPRARAAHLLNLLREWRGGVHNSAVCISGLTPLEAIMSDGGEGYVKFFGWPKPWPEKDGKAAEMAQVAAMVDGSCGVTIAAVLSHEDAERLLELAREACALLAS